MSISEDAKPSFPHEAFQLGETYHLGEPQEHYQTEYNHTF